MGKNTPWDIYVDEYVGSPHYLGLLAVPNTASFDQKLQHCRDINRLNGNRQLIRRTMHWTDLTSEALSVATGWVDCVRHHRGAKFFLIDWPPRQKKEYVLLKFLHRFCRIKRLEPPYNVVMILDFHTGHAGVNIQNTIRETAQIARCYHLPRRATNCLQCCDLLLGAHRRLLDEPTIRMEYESLAAERKKRPLSDSESKRFFAGYFSTVIDSGTKSFHDLRSSAGR